VNARKPATTHLTASTPAAALRRALVAGLAFGGAFLLAGLALAARALFGPGPTHAGGDQAFDQLAYVAYVLATTALASAAGYAAVTALGGVGRSASAPRGWHIDAVAGIAGFILHLLGIPFVLLGALPFRDRIPEAAVMATMVSPGVMTGLVVVLLARFSARTQSPPGAARAMKEDAL
jgi:hypothetical protein